MTEVVCPRCDARGHADEANFCFNCGLRIGGELPRLDVPEGGDPRAYFPQVTANALADFIIADAEIRGDDA